MSVPPVAVQGIGQVSIPVKDLDAAIRFYRDTLGLPLLFQAPGMAFLESGGVRLLLSVPERPEFDHKSSILYFRTPDIHTGYDALVSHGAELAGNPHKIAERDGIATWMLFFKDPDGNTHALMSEVAV
ncbi:VOC family protein [Gorillibacterium sp. sgz5001074]|uniref:VOC family protein n=1 Tax=Gorillibacterium sp. sgz5001074 TaxID=3446695 RepID=UPI003F66F62E